VAGEEVLTGAVTVVHREWQQGRVVVVRGDVAVLVRGSGPGCGLVAWLHSTDEELDELRIPHVGTDVESVALGAVPAPGAAQLDAGTLGELPEAVRVYRAY
jgi:hypothetical protein